MKVWLKISPSKQQHGSNVVVSDSGRVGDGGSVNGDGGSVGDSDDDVGGFTGGGKECPVRVGGGSLYQ